MDSVQQNDYTLQAIKSQERILHDFIRKYIDIEARCVILSTNLDQLSNELNSKNNEIENLNNLFKQATNSLELLTVQNKNYENQINNFHARMAEKDRNYNELIGVKNLHESKHKEYKKEYERLFSQLENASKTSTTKKQKIVKSETKVEDDF